MKLIKYPSKETVDGTFETSGTEYGKFVRYCSLYYK